MALPPRPFLTEEEIRALTDEERAVAVAEWSSYNARLRREQDQRAARGTYRGGRGRGSRGTRGFYQPYARAQYGQGKFQNLSTTFNRSVQPDTSPASVHVKPAPSARNENAVKLPAAPASKEPCPAFTSTGLCKRPRCPHVHDPDKTAICKQFLFKGSCANGQSCPLSHESSPHRSPNCIHFQNNSCNKDDCRYSHVHVNVDAPVCEAFARLGYCEKGDHCTQRHAFECPAFSNTGACDVQGCRLPHVVHAGRLRKARVPSPEANSHSGSSSSEEDNVLDPVDQSHALTQQADFVPLD